MTPAQAMARAIQRDAADADEIDAQHILLLAGIMLCDARRHDRKIRPCKTCRTDVRGVL